MGGVWGGAPRRRESVARQLEAGKATSSPKARNWRHPEYAPPNPLSSVTDTPTTMFAELPPKPNATLGSSLATTAHLRWAPRPTGRERPQGQGGSAPMTPDIMHACGTKITSKSPQTRAAVTF